MMIVKNTLCFSGYPLRALGADLAEGLRASMPAWVGSCDALLIRLESFLQITGRTLSLSQLGTDESQAAFTQFSAALLTTAAEGAMEWKSAHTLLRRLMAALKVLGDEGLSRFKLPADGKTNDQILNLMEDARKLAIQERMPLWRDWTARNKNGKEVVFRMYPIYERMGDPFTTEFFQACATAAMGGRSTTIPYVNKLAKHIGGFNGEINQESFQDRNWLFTFIENFCVESIQASHADGRQVYCATRDWSRFALFLETAVLGKIWADLHRSVPRPKAPAPSNAESRVMRTPAGNEVRRVLMTDVPLHVSDSEAKELLFHDIKADLDAVKRWARCEIANARERRYRRLKLAPLGMVSKPGPNGKNSGLDWRLTRNCPEWLAHAAATFESRGLVVGCDRPTASAYYPKPLDETAWELGLPTPHLLLAHAALLVAEHPAITSSFLDKLEIYDKNNKQIGFLETDGGHYLVGEKSRKGSRKAEQRIKLNKETTEVVREVIALTEPLRAELRARKVPTWRRLFIATPSMGSMPKFWFGSGVASRCAMWLCGRLAALAGLDPPAAFELAKRFTLRSLRASSAVTTYLETSSVQKFSEVLGHEECRPDLLDTYLPRPVQEWFVERWVRIFQCGLIVEAMRDSRHLLRATNFKTMEELDSFLEHHAFRNLPRYLDDRSLLEDGANSSRVRPRIVIGLDPAILTILLSLAEAVRETKREVCGRARRWAVFCDRLTAHLEAQCEQPELRGMLATARLGVDISAVRDLIYA